MPKICQNSSFMIFQHSFTFLHYYHCNLKIICLINNRSVDCELHKGGNLPCLVHCHLQPEYVWQIIAVLMRERMPMGLWDLRWCCALKGTGRVLQYSFHLWLHSTDSFSVTGPSEPIVAMLGADTVLPCRVYPAMNVENMEIRWFRNQFSHQVAKALEFQL